MTNIFCTVALFYSFEAFFCTSFRTPFAGRGDDLLHFACRAFYSIRAGLPAMLRPFLLWAILHRLFTCRPFSVEMSVMMCATCAILFIVKLCHVGDIYLSVLPCICDRLRRYACHQLRKLEAVPWWPTCRRAIFADHAMACTVTCRLAEISL